MSDEIVREIERLIAESDSPPEIFWTQKLLDRLKARPIQPVSELVARARKEADPAAPVGDEEWPCSLLEQLADALSASEARAERYRVALEWYAHEAMKPIEVYGGGMNSLPQYPIYKDDGKRAREALGVGDG